jgi:cell wall-associated NlpC family hydrolase
MQTMHRTNLHLLLITAALASAALLGGCASVSAPSAARSRAPAVERVTVPVVRERAADEALLSPGRIVAELAMGMVGTPYRYGGTDPEQGFDCSGLVFYAYGQVGHDVPRTSREQFRAARKIALDHVGAGDVMFFQDEAKLSHVGIYVGDGLFVHAPAKGQRVTVASIQAPYYQQHLVAVGRLLPLD